jgi:hypothetical protein
LQRVLAKLGCRRHERRRAQASHWARG